jgi:hypothetical protein
MIWISTKYDFPQSFKSEKTSSVIFAHVVLPFVVDFTSASAFQILLVFANFSINKIESL